VREMREWPVDERTSDSGVDDGNRRSLMAVRSSSVIAVSVALGLVFISCGDESTRSGSDPGDTAVSDAIDQEAQSPTMPPTAPEADLVTTTTVEVVPAACAAEALLPVVAALFPENDMWNIVDVDVADCQNGYARVFAIADQSVCDVDTPQCLEAEQIFLADRGGTWEYLTSGTGISCGDPSDLGAEMVAACEALGLS
jgi:hypothetical protein